MADYLNQSMLDAMGDENCCDHGYDWLCPICDRGEVKRLENRTNRKPKKRASPTPPEQGSEYDKAVEALAPYLPDGINKPLDFEPESP